MRLFYTGVGNTEGRLRTRGWLVLDDDLWPRSLKSETRPCLGTRGPWLRPQARAPSLHPFLSLLFLLSSLLFPVTPFYLCSILLCLFFAPLHLLLSFFPLFPRPLHVISRDWPVSCQRCPWNTMTRQHGKRWNGGRFACASPSMLWRVGVHLRAFWSEDRERFSTTIFNHDCFYIAMFWRLATVRHFGFLTTREMWRRHLRCPSDRKPQALRSSVAPKINRNKNPEKRGPSSRIGTAPTRFRARHRSRSPGYQGEVYTRQVPASVLRRGRREGRSPLIIIIPRRH